ncbi:response regulator transcription factor [Alicyclobacillus sp. SO9]|uniref:response regulator transcription factor n=1 Tax=Alicyclobacillus sp. SO9 TaxID=2665646 RepID=UPI0018E83A8F|nr:response regulator transcription factor [Alicyclobacillus sp. SO9]QQE79933.1 response regulator transcription factor [Alicyclobacillus sp. SO9]
MTTVLIVDDDSHIRELVGVYLQRSGFTILEACDGTQALQTLEEHKVHLVVLDIMMPSIDGFEVCAEIRRTSLLPILMLTAKGDTTQKVKGLHLGADDYLVKPFDPDELVARIQALLRRYQIATEQIIEIGKLHLDNRAHSILFNGTAVTLPRKEFDLLFKLASYPGQTLSRDTLIEDIWGYDFEGDERTVDVHVKRLRDKFPEQLCAFKIRTIRGLGYRLEVTS